MGVMRCGLRPSKEGGGRRMFAGRRHGSFVLVAASLLIGRPALADPVDEPQAPEASPRVLDRGAPEASAANDEAPVPRAAATSSASTERDSASRLSVHPSIEVGVGSTFVVRGFPFYRSRTDPATLSSVLVTLKNLGPGSLTLGSFHSSALTRPTRHNGLSPELDPIAFYGLPIGDHVHTTFGYFAHISPDLAQPDAMHEVLATVSLEKLLVRPAVEVYAEFARMYGAYANVNVSKQFAFGAVSVEPKILVGAHGYDQPFGGFLSLPLALREVTASVAVTWRFAEPFYVVARGAYSYAAIPNWFHEDSFLGRSTPFAGLALGAAL